MNDLATEGDRTVLVAKVVAAVQDGRLTAIGAESAGITSQDAGPVAVAPSSAGGTPGPALTAARGALLTAASEVVSTFATATANPANSMAFGGGLKAASLSGMTSTMIEARLGGPPSPDGLTAFLLDHGAGPDVMFALPAIFAVFRDPSPLAGTVRSDLADWLTTRDPDVGLVTVSGDAPTSAPVVDEPRGDELGAAHGREDVAIAPVAGPGQIPGLLGDLAGRGGPALPFAQESPGSLGLAGDDLRRDGPTLPEAAEPSHAKSACDEPGLFDEAIADVEAALSRGADLLAAFSPFERVALEHTIDRFLGEVGELGAVLSNLEVTATLIPNLVATAGAIAVLEAVRRRVRGPSGEQVEDAEGDGDAGPPGLPGLPRGWALEEL
ncbi:MAG TPA: hypothetical protein VGH33_24605 [Isosphaeraceae bacterium]